RIVFMTHPIGFNHWSVRPPEWFKAAANKRRRALASGSEIGHFHHSPPSAVAWAAGAAPVTEHPPKSQQPVWVPLSRTVFERNSGFARLVPADPRVRHRIGRGKIGLDVEERRIVEAVEPDHGEPCPLDFDEPRHAHGNRVRPRRRAQRKRSALLAIMP